MQSSPFHFKALRLLAIAMMSCAVLAACKGLSTSTPGGLVPAQPQSYAAAPDKKKKNPDAVRVVPFLKTKKLGSSAGQPVYALFTSTSLPLVSSTPGISVFGAPPVSGQAGPLAQIATVTGSGSGQNLYVDAKGRLFELTDVKTKTLMLLRYMSKKKSSVVETTVCRSGDEIGTIEETTDTQSGITSTTVKKHRAECPRALTGAVAFGASMDAVSNVTPSSASNIHYYSCMMGSTLFPSASDKFDKATQLAGSLKGIGDTYGQMQALFGTLCDTSALIIVQHPQAPSKCSDFRAEGQPVCAYQPPPVALTAAPASCPASTVAVVFNAPAQTCDGSVAYSVGSGNAPYTVKSSNTSIVAVSPTSGTVTGSGNLSVTLTAGAVGGAATVTVTIAGQVVTTFAVTNAWASSAPKAIASLAFALQSGTLPLGQTMTFALSAKSASGITISGTYDHPIVLTGNNLTIVPAQVNNSAQASQVTATWNDGFAGSGVGTITASGDEQTASVQIDPGTGFAYFKTGRNPNYDVVGFLMTLGPDGKLYYGSLGPTTCTPNGFCYSKDGAVVRFDPATGASTEIELHGEPNGLFFTSDGALWIAGGVSHNLYRFPPNAFNGASLQTIPVPSPNPESSYTPRLLAQDGNGNVWFTDLSGGRVLKIPLAGPYKRSAIVGYPLPKGPAGTPRLPARPHGIVYGTDQQLYVTDWLNGVVDQFSPSDGTTLEQILTPQQVVLGSSDTANPGFITKGQSGKLVFTLLGPSTNPIMGAADSLTTGATNSVAVLNLPGTPAGSEPYAIGSNGKFAYYQDLINGLGLINTLTGSVRLVPIAPIASSNFFRTTNGIAVLGDGSAWFTCYGNNGLAPPPYLPLCVGHTVYTATSGARNWSIFPGPNFAISGFGALSSQLVGVMESPTVNSGPFAAANSNSSVCSVGRVKDHNFLVTGLSVGTCTVTVTDAANRSAQVQVSVVPSPSPTPSAARRSQRVTF